VDPSQGEGLLAPDHALQAAAIGNRRQHIVTTVVLVLVLTVPLKPEPKGATQQIEGVQEDLEENLQKKNGGGDESVLSSMEKRQQQKNKSSTASSIPITVFVLVWPSKSNQNDTQQQPSRSKPARDRATRHGRLFFSFEKSQQKQIGFRGEGKGQLEPTKI
jgi:hypothetical protein